MFHCFNVLRIYWVKWRIKVQAHMWFRYSSMYSMYLECIKILYSQFSIWECMDSVTQSELKIFRYNHTCEEYNEGEELASPFLRFCPIGVKVTNIYVLAWILLLNRTNIIRFCELILSFFRAVSMWLEDTRAWVSVPSPIIISIQVFPPNIT